MKNGKVVIGGRGGKSFQAGYDAGYTDGIETGHNVAKAGKQPTLFGEIHTEHAAHTDVVKVVRCEKCKRNNLLDQPFKQEFAWCNEFGKRFSNDFFCAHGEERGEITP